MKELEVVHPAAKMVVMAAEAQEKEIGDGTNLVVVFAGEILSQAENLLRMGLHTSDIIAGYTKAGEKALHILEELVIKKVEDVRNEEQVTRAIKSAISAKQYGYEDLITPIVARACIQVCPKNPKNFNVDNVRVTKIDGGHVNDTTIMKGFVLGPRDASGSVKHARDAKVAVFGCSVDIATTETKSTVVIKNADDLLNYNKSEEKSIEASIKAIAEAGVKVIVTGGSFGELAMHFIERHGMMAVKVPSKFDLRRVCQAVKASPLVRLGVPTAEEMGHCDYVGVDEIGDTKVVVFRQENDPSSKVSTIIVRGSTSNIMDDVERCIDDGVNVYKALCRDPRLLPGAGATEIELAKRLTAIAEETPGLDQYAIRKYASSFEVVPRTLAESSGLVPADVISGLYAAHAQGKTNIGVDVTASTGAEAATLDADAKGIYDSFITKYWAIRLATDAAVSVLSVDQIIMAKQAGGPKPRAPGPADGED
eukprot:GEZU01029560.1.p1 GENE.GEZU01029560.1~~GEZU01029560.1.p1  ORF type:complete len:506 (-),score=198.49 GEZU01029560.1:105-1544(-)